MPIKKGTGLDEIDAVFLKTAAFSLSSSIVTYVVYTYGWVHGDRAYTHCMGQYASVHNGHTLPLQYRDQPPSYKEILDPDYLDVVHPGVLRETQCAGNSHPIRIGIH